MPTDLPIACSLSASDLTRGLADMAELGRAALTARSTAPQHAELRFQADAGVADRVRAVAAAESQCCPFLTLRVEDAPGTVVLTLDAPDGAEAVLAALVDAFGAPSRAGR